MSRTNNSIKNIKYAIVGQAVALLVSLISRKIFVSVLGTKYLGLNGLFSNILSILSLAELGVGPAIVYSMYKPLADQNEYKLRALMRLYRNAYITIGIVVFIVGAMSTPFLGFFINDIPDIPNIRVIYLMFVINSSISYFFSYKRAFVIANEKKYIDTIYRYGFYIMLNIVQIIILLFTGNYILYIVLQIANTFIENMCISMKVNQLYPFLKDKGVAKLDESDKNSIIRNIKAILCHKVGSILVMSTDNIIISKFAGFINVGLYSNYLLIINAVNTVFAMIFQSITASVGNLGATEGNEKNKFIFDCTNLVGFWIYGFASISLINLCNPFIILWLGQEYVFPMSIVVSIIIVFYLTGMRKSVLTFRDGLGLFWNDRYKSLFEAGINLIVSIILAQKMGIIGVIIGTIISTLITCFWIEPYVLFKYGFKVPVRSYFMKYFFNTIVMIMTGFITYLISNLFSSYTIIGFVGKLIVCGVVTNILFIIVFFRTKEFKYLLKIMRLFICKNRFTGF